MVFVIDGEFYDEFVMVVVMNEVCRFGIEFVVFFIGV